MVIPQIRNTLINLLLILIGGPLAGAYFAWQTGEIPDWRHLWAILQHGALASAMMAIGWLLMRSPYAGKFTELLSTTTTAQGATSTTSVKISEPAPPAAPV